MAKPVKELEILKHHLAKHQLKLTRQRENILTTFLKMEHVTAEQMYRLLAKKDPHIGLATVYRTLKLLCETGLAQEQHFGTQTQFDNVAHKGHHDHLICTTCDKIIEFENCQIEELQEEDQANEEDEAKEGQQPDQPVIHRFVSLLLSCS